LTLSRLDVVDSRLERSVSRPQGKAGDGNPIDMAQSLNIKAPRYMLGDKKGDSDAHKRKGCVNKMVPDGPH
jgi:hypothetical protein